MLVKKIEGRDKDGNEKVTCFFSSNSDRLKPSNVAKTEYFPQLGSLFIYFLKKRMHKDSRYLFRPNKASDKSYMVQVYHISSVDSNMYRGFEGADSQGSYYSTYMKNNPLLVQLGKFKLMGYETEGFLNESLDAIGPNSYLG